MRWKTLFFVFVILTFVFVSAELGNPAGEIVKKYFDEDYLKGSLNVSFENPLNDLIIAKFSNGLEYKISVFDFIENSSEDYTCSPLDCQNDYKIKGEGFSGKTFDLTNNKVVGFKLTGKNVDVKSFNLNIGSDVSSSCENQLFIDVLDNGNVNWVNDKFSNEICGSKLNPVCSEGDFSNNVDIDEITYCDKFELPVAPAFRVSAGLEKVQGSYRGGELKAEIYKNGELKASCDLSNPDIARSECDFNYVNKEVGEHYICVSKIEGGGYGNYTLPANLAKGCGFHWDPSTNPEGIASYDISVEAKKYSPVGNFNLNSEIFSRQNGVSIERYIEDYLQEKYQGNCLQGCIVPLKFYGKNQDISLSNFEIKYDVQGGSGLSENKLYELEKTSAILKTNQTVFDLANGNFKLPAKNGNYSVNLFLGNEKVLFQNISIYYSAQGPRSLVRQVYPKIVAAANPTLFKVFIDPSVNDSNLVYVWNFGDGEEETEKNEIVYSFSNVGNQTLKVTLKDSQEVIGENSFKITVESPKNAINSTIKEYKIYLENVEQDLNELPEEYKPYFEDLIDIDSLKLKINNFEKEYKQYVSSSETLEGDYVALMKEIINLDIPVSIQFSEVSNFPLAFSKEDVDLEDIESVFGDGDYTDVDKTKNRIVSWFIENVDVQIKRSVYSLFYLKSEEDILTEFDVLISPKETFDYKGYFMIGDVEENLIFRDNYEIPQKNTAVTGIVLSLSDDQNVIFAKEGNTGFLGLGMYLTPELKILKTSEVTPGEKSMSNVFIVLLAIAGLLIVALIIYYLLNRWYETKYESFLFKNKSNLRNLIYFIENAKKKGLSDEEIGKQLKKGKWSGEQINYALNTYKGNKVGMNLKFWKRNR
jgi:hypothetical protein